MKNTLSNLKKGEICRIKSITAADEIKQRLYDIGMIPGTAVKCLQKSMFGDPTAYLIRGTVIALRKQNSSEIFVTRSEGVIV